MGRVVRIDQPKVDRLAHELAAGLRGKGSITVDASGVDDVEVWRKAARKAGRLLGRRVRTGVSGRRLWVIDIDHEVTDDEIRRAGDAVSEAIARYRRPRRL